MNQNTLAVTPENEELNRQLAQLAVEFLDLFTRHKEMVEDEYVILTSLYLEKLGCFQLELLQKKTEAARLKMKMKLIQAAMNHVCSRLMDAGKVFVCRVVSKSRIDSWLHIDAHIFMVD